jgi:hypothetical protein
MQKITVITALAVTLLFSVPSKSNTPTVPVQKQEKGWIQLFDGKTLNGWHNYGNKPAAAVWTVQDGVITYDKSKREKGLKISNDLVTDKEYENFHFKYDWKIAANGNSGLIFWVQEDSSKHKQTYHTGPEMQVLDNDGHSDGKINKHRAGNLYDLVAGKEGAVKPVGEWNTAEIIANKGKLEFILNGVSVLTTTYGDDNWKQMIAGSKFKEWPEFGTVFKGHFALQDHGNDVWFRNIMIKKL